MFLVKHLLILTSVPIYIFHTKNTEFNIKGYSSDFRLLYLSHPWKKTQTKQLYRTVIPSQRA